MRWTGAAWVGADHATVLRNVERFAAQARDAEVFGDPYRRVMDSGMFVSASV